MKIEEMPLEEKKITEEGIDISQIIALNEETDRLIGAINDSLKGVAVDESNKYLDDMRAILQSAGGGTIAEAERKREEMAGLYERISSARTEPMVKPEAVEGVRNVPSDPELIEKVKSIEEISQAITNKIGEMTDEGIKAEKQKWFDEAMAKSQDNLPDATEKELILGIILDDLEGLY